MKRMMWTMGLTLVLLSTNSKAANVIRDGKEWLQPADFTSLSWNDVEAVCPEAQGFLCDGELNGIDVTGYTFASIEQVTDLFNSYGIDPPLGTAPDFLQEIDSVWAPAILLDFNPTSLQAATLICHSSSSSNETIAVGAAVTDEAPGSYDYVGNDATIPKHVPPNTRGTCLYRDAPPAPKVVSTMSTYMLILTMLGLIAIASGGLFRRRKPEGR